MNDIYSLQPETYKKLIDLHNSLVNLQAEVNGTRMWATKEKMEFAQELNEMDNKLMTLLKEYSRKKVATSVAILQIK